MTYTWTLTGGTITSAGGTSGVTSGTTNVQCRALLEREIDIALCSDPLECTDGILSRPIFTEPFVLLHPFSRGEGKSLSAAQVRESLKKTARVKLDCKSSVTPARQAMTK